MLHACYGCDRYPDDLYINDWGVADCHVGTFQKTQVSKPRCVL